MGIEWAAGLFEGEGWTGNGGSKYVTKSGEVHRYPCKRCVVQSTDEDVIQTFSKILGVGKMRGPYGPRGRGKKPFWTWQADGREAVIAITALLPFMHGRRREQMLKVLS